MMEEQEHVAEKQQPQVIQIMTTEHYNLQAARSVATSEATSRSNLFISTVSITLVALALIGQISKLGTAFFVFALLLFPSLFFWAWSALNVPSRIPSKIIRVCVASTAFGICMSRLSRKSKTTLFCPPMMTH